MTTLALFGSAEDRSYINKFRPLIGARALKVSLTDEEYFSSIAAKIKANGITDIICTNQETLLPLLSSQPDFRRPLNMNGSDKKLSLDDYAGSFFKIAAHKLGTAHDVSVLILNPLKHLVSTPSGPFVFKRFLSKIFEPEKWFPQTPFTWEIWEPAKSEFLLSKFSTALLIAIDIETKRGCLYRSMQCVGYAALFPDGSTHAIVVPYKDILAHDFVKRLNASAPPKVFQGGMYDNLYLLRWNAPVYNWLYDTLHLFHAWYSELPKRLDFVTAFSVREIRFWKDDAKAGGLHELYEYNARDCWATLTAWCALIGEVPKWVTDNYLLEFPLVFPCLHMEADGLTLDKEKFEISLAQAKLELTASETKLVAWFGDKFNANSPDQCKRLLKVLGMGDVESSDEEHMMAAAAVHPFNELIVSEVLAYRQQAKLISTYLNWSKFWGERLYYKSDPAGTKTGRLASTESSYWTGLQIHNIPQGPAVKSFITVDAGWEGIGEGDKAQAEARCVGYLSGCKSLIDLVESDKDYHSWNAHKFFGVEYAAVTKPLRNLAKRVNHGSNYGMGATVLLATMGPRAVAEARLLLKLPASWTLTQVCTHLLAVYEKTYPEIKKDWYNDITRTIKLTKKLVSALGWTRYFFGDPSKHKPSLNAAVAHGPQNLNAGILNISYYDIWRASVYGDLKGLVRVKAQIHDSILFVWRGAGTPELVRQRMNVAIPVKATDGITRTMLIPTDMSATKKDGSPAIYWSDTK